MKKMMMTLVLLGLSGMTLADTSTNTLQTTVDSSKKSFVDNIGLFIQNSTETIKDNSTVVGASDTIDAYLSYKITDKDKVTLLEEFAMKKKSEQKTDFVNNQLYLKYARTLTTEATHWAAMTAALRTDIFTDPDYIKGTHVPATVSARVSASKNVTDKWSTSLELVYEKLIRTTGNGEIGDNYGKIYLNNGYTFTEKFSAGVFMAYYRKFSQTGKTLTDSLRMIPSVSYQVHKKVGLDLYADMFPFNFKHNESLGYDKEFASQASIGLTVNIAVL